MRHLNLISKYPTFFNASVSALFSNGILSNADIAIDAETKSGKIFNSEKSLIEFGSDTFSLSDDFDSLKEGVDAETNQKLFSYLLGEFIFDKTGNGVSFLSLESTMEIEDALDDLDDLDSTVADQDRQAVI